MNRTNATSRRVLWLVGLIGCVSAACSAPKPRPRQQPDTPLPFPAAGLIPAQASLALLVKQVDSAGRAVRMAVDVALGLDADDPGTALAADAESHQGIDPFDPHSIEQAGFDPRGDAALFWMGSSYTLLLPVKDDQKLARYLARRVRDVKVFVGRHHGRDVTTWHKSSSERVSFTRIGRYLAVDYGVVAPESHGVVRPPSSSSPPGGASGQHGRDSGAPRGDGERLDGAGQRGWIDRMQRAEKSGRTLARSPAFAALLGRAKRSADVVALVNPTRYDSELGRVLRAVRGVQRDEQRCSAAEHELRQVRSLSAALRVVRDGGKRGLEIDAWAELSPTAHRGLERWMGRPLVLASSIWSDAALRVRNNVELAAPLELLGRWSALRGSGCGGVIAAVADSGRIWQRLHSAVSGTQIGGRIAAALLAVGGRAGRISARGAVVGSVAGGGRPRWLALAAAALRARQETVAGTEVLRIDPPSVLADPVRIALNDGLVRIAIGDGIAEQLLGADPTGKPDGTVAGFDLWPGRLDIESLLATGLVYMSSSDRKRLIATGRRVERLSLWVRARTPGLHLHAAYRRR